MSQVSDNLFFANSRKGCTWSEVSKETTINYNKAHFTFSYFAKWLSLPALFETEKHIEAKLCLLLQTAYCKFAFLSFVDVYLYGRVILQGYISLHNNSPSTTKTTGCEIVIYVVLH